MANTRKPILKAVDAELADSSFIEFTFQGETYRVKKRFKRLRFMRLLGSNPGEAMAMALHDDDLEILEDMDLSDEEFGELLEAISEAMVGGKGN